MRLAFLLALLGCAVPLPSEPDMPRYASPNAEWLAGFREAERCTGLHGDVTQIRWHTVPGNHMTVDGDSAVIGYTVGHDIYLSEDWSGHRWLARHESIHALGIHDHPPAVFATACHAIWGDARDSL
jgi:hypothetical protein